MPTISIGAQSVEPMLVIGYESRRETRNLLHPILGQAQPAVTLRAAHTREGVLEYLCADHAQALAVEAIHAGIGALTLEDATLPGIAMTYVVSGPIETRVDPETRERWLVRVPYAEVGS